MDLNGPLGSLADRPSVVVPVFRGLEQTRRCIDSVIASEAAAHADLVAIDDASDDIRIVEYLRQKAEAGQIRVLRNPTNLGFVATANRGLSLNPGQDIVLLNSDTEVTGDWFWRLVQAAYRSDDIATVTPWSNNATICSYPFHGWSAGLPGRLGLAGLAEVFALTHAQHIAEIPTAVGCCMYIRRAAINTIGLFDATAFGRGYGEENDFCMRATAAGWRHVLAADVFVFHEGGVSFGPESQELQVRATSILRAKHPGYAQDINKFIVADPLDGLRRAIDLARVDRLPGELKCVLDEHALRRESSVAQFKSQVIESIAEHDRLREQIAQVPVLRERINQLEDALARAESHVRAREAEIELIGKEIDALRTAFSAAEALALSRQAEIQALDASLLGRLNRLMLRVAR